MLVEVPETFIQDYSIQLDRGSNHEGSGWVQFSGPLTKHEVTIRIPEAGIEIKL